MEGASSSTTGQLVAALRVYAYVGARRLRGWLEPAAVFPPDPTGGPLWLLGERYGDEAEGEELHVLSDTAAAEFEHDLRSRVWVTYRTGFTPLPLSQLYSDVGWGCTLRSGQMLLAHTLLTLHCGRHWRRADEGPLPAEVEAVLTQLGDTAEAPYGIHSIMKHANATEGQWLRPSQVCRALAALVNEHGGGMLRAFMVPGEHDTSACGGVPVLCKAAVEALATHQGQQPWTPVLVLVPVVLGAGASLPAAYGDALTAMLRLPQSVGIVGGPPGASLFLVGHQAQQVFYLDPHDAHAAPANGAPMDGSSYFCERIRHLPVTALDPSLALGLLCRSRTALDDLCTSLAAHATLHAPCLTAVEEQPPHLAAQHERTPSIEEEGLGTLQDDEAWELM